MIWFVGIFLACIVLLWSHERWHQKTDRHLSEWSMMMNQLICSDNYNANTIDALDDYVNGGERPNVEDCHYDYGRALWWADMVVRDSKTPLWAQFA